MLTASLPPNRKEVVNVMQELIGRRVKIEYHYGVRAAVLYGTVREVEDHMLLLDATNVEYEPPLSSGKTPEALSGWINTAASSCVAIWFKE